LCVGGQANIYEWCEEFFDNFCYFEMGKSKSDVVIEASIHEALLENDECKIGLVIGAIAENSEFHVAHIAETLEDDKGVKEDASDDEQVEERKKFNFDTAQPNTLAFHAKQPNTLAFHAKQVIPMIPGGLTILGIYAVDSRDTIFTFNTEPRVKSMITAVVKGTQKTFSWYSGIVEDEKEMLFIHYNPKSKKFSGKIFEVGSLKSRPCDIVSRSLNWAKLECQFDTEGVMHVPKKDAGAPLKKNLQSLMKSFEESLNSAKFLINGHVPSTNVVYKEVAYDPEHENSVDELDLEEFSDDNEIRDETTLQRKLNSEGNPTSSSSVHILLEKEPGILRCETPVDTNESCNGNRSVVEDEFINHLHMQGKISVIAFVPEGSSTVCMADRLRNDIIRSMSSRIVMHCESLIDEESTTEPIHNTLLKTKTLSLLTKNHLSQVIHKFVDP
ncbi:unnamed protein product, partial [Allacma fusca]